MYLMGAFLPSIPSVPWTTVLPGNHVRAKIEALLSNHLDSGSKAVKTVVVLTRALIAAKRLFPQMLDEENTGAPLFNLNAPLRHLQVRRENIARLLHDISPNLDDENTVSGIWKIVKNSRPPPPPKRPEAGRKDSITNPIDLDNPPAKWPTTTMLFVLSIGSWEQIDLSHAMLAGVDLRGVQWRGVKLRNANLSMAQLARSDLSNSDLSGCDLSHANLIYANMQSANVSNADLRNADMTAANASDASFAGACFEKAKLRYTQFCRATLDDANGIACEQGTDFTNARLDRAQISIPNRHILPDRRFLIPMANVFRAHQLSSLSSISLRYNDLYNQAVLDLIAASMADQDSHPDFNFFTRHLLIPRRCWADPQIHEFIVEALLPPLLDRWNHSARSNHEPALEQVLLFISETGPTLDWPRYCGAVSQLLTAIDTSMFPAQLAKLQRQFSQHPDIAPVAEALEAIEQDLSPLCSIFISADGNRAVAYDNMVLQNLARGLGSPFNGYQFQRDAHGQFQNEALRDLDTAHACAIPCALYNIAPPATTAAKLIDYIFDNTVYKNKFIHALTCKTLAPEADGLYQHRISLADDVLLTPHLMHFCEAEPQSTHFKISMEHTSRLWRIFNNTSAPLTDNAANRARMLLCLGTLFVRYSSAALFGTEKDSLISVREYARACLNRAHALDARLFGSSAAEIEDILLGVPRGVGQCAGGLAITLSAFIRDIIPYDAALQTCFTAIYPTAWE